MLCQKQLLSLLLSFFAMLGETDPVTLHGLTGESIHFPIPGNNCSLLTVNFLRYPNGSKPIMYYHKNSEPDIFENYRNRITFSNVTFLLSLKHLVKNDEGTYDVNCDVKVMCKFTLKISEPLRKPAIQQTKAPSLICEGQDGVTYKWTSSRWLVAPENATIKELRLPGTRGEMCGVYTCTVRNSLSNASETYSVLPFGHDWRDSTSLCLGVASLTVEVLFAITGCCTLAHSHLKSCVALYEISSSLSLMSGTLGCILWWSVNSGTLPMFFFVVLVTILIVRTGTFIHKCLHQRQQPENNNQGGNLCKGPWHFVNRYGAMVTLMASLVYYTWQYWPCGRSHFLWEPFAGIFIGVLYIGLALLLRESKASINDTTRV